MSELPKPPFTKEQIAAACGTSEGYDENGNRLPSIAVKLIVKDGGHHLSRDIEPVTIGLGGDLGFFVYVNKKPDTQQAAALAREMGNKLDSLLFNLLTSKL